MKNYKVEKEFEHKGYRCVVIATRLGHRCGYIGVDKNNCAYGKDYDDLPDIDVHGGLTFSAGGQNSEHPIKSNLWWFGFDCAHCGDGKDMDIAKELNDENTYKYFLEMEKRFSTGGIVRSLEYCIEECKKVVNQVIELNSK